MKIGYLSAVVLNLPVLLNFQGGGRHFTIGEMKWSLTPIGWAVLILLIVFVFFLIIRLIRSLAKHKTLK
jgi:hypothetical protein